MRTTNSPSCNLQARPVFKGLRSTRVAHSIHSSRHGITLLFVVSMIVLFLLMGTAFVVLAGDFMKSAKVRARHDSEKFDQPEASIEKALYDVLRGPDLNDLNSPLRFHDILSDQYGFGLKAYVAGIEFYDLSRPDSHPVNTGQIVRLRLKNAITSGVENRARRILDDPNDIPDLADVSLTEFSETYSGQVLSFVNGPQKGFSARIVNHEFDSATGNHWFWVSIKKIGTVSPAYLNSLVNSEVIINNRDFSGNGPAYNPAAAAGTPKLGLIALQPNRSGQLLTSEINTTGYVSDLSTNEPWDSADAFSTPFLSGRTDAPAASIWIPSFHRETLVAANGGSRLPTDRHIFSAFPLIPDAASPAGVAFASATAGPIPLVDADNDGTPDSIWMDLNFPVKSHRGTFYKPLVAYKIVDLDGRLNINAHGELTDSFEDRFINNPLTMRGTLAEKLPRGQGFGPADISLRPLFLNQNTFAVDFASYQFLVKARHGSDGLIGSMRNSVSGARAKMFGHPFNVVNWNASNFGTVGNLFASSPMDVRGRFSLGRPLQAAINTSVSRDNFVDRNYADFPNSMPVIDLGASNLLADQEIHNPLYGLSLEANHTDDTPFTPLELERVLRSSDVDTNLLSGRLWNIVALPDTPASFWSDKRELITTTSFEVPLLTSNFAKLLFDKVSIQLHGTPFNQLPRVVPPAIDADRNAVRTFINTNMATLFAPELFQGLKMHVNRPFGNGYDDDGDGVVDNPEEANAEVNFDQQNHFSPRPAADFRMDLSQDRFFNNDQNSRTEFARHLFCLAMLVSDDYVQALALADRQIYIRKIAQWAVNVVDYRDPDSIMTRFPFDPQPFVDQHGTGRIWDPGVDASGNPDPQLIVWGMERPELLITESFAAHARRIQGTSGNEEQGLRPEPFAFIELYNPWTQNSINQTFDSSLYRNQGVDLSRTNTNRDPVWRIQIDRPVPSPATPQPVRFVYFTDPGAAPRDVNLLTQEIFYSDNPTLPVRPGSQAVIGTEGIPNGPNRFRCYMGRLDTKTETDEVPDNLQLNDTNYIELDLSNATNHVIRRNFPAPSSRSVSTIVLINRFVGQTNPASNPRPFSVSDPFGGYTDVSGGAATPVPDGYRYSPALAILGDPIAPVAGDFNRNANDMVAILQHDRTSRQFRIIQLQRLANPEQPWDALLNPYISVDVFDMDLLAFNGTRDSSLDPTIPGGSALPNADALERNNAGNPDRVLWRSQRGQRLPAAAPFPNHYLALELQESLGMTNDLFEPANPANQAAFPWLSWNNRPYMSHLELMNVPVTGPLEFVNDFSTFLTANNPYTQFSDNRLAGNFQHLINFFHSQNPSPNLYALMELLEVPSRFADTTQELLPRQPVTGGSPIPGFGLNPSNTISRYREPGKINLNSIYDQRVYQGMMGGFAGIAGGLDFPTFKVSRGIGQVGQENPFRPAYARDLVPPAGFTGINGPGSTLLRPNPLNPQVPLFDFVSTDLSFETDRNAYFRNAQRQRLGNLTTNRSSVFAIWITVGYFECDASGNLAGINNELGIEEGTVRRHRGFYIFDRSIPVAFEPGKNHNIENAILVRRIIE